MSSGGTDFEQLGLFGDLTPEDGRTNQYGFPLEDRRPIARESDPETSHAGASHVRPKLVGLRAAFHDVLQVLGKATANEVAAAAVGTGLVTNSESVRKRARELVDLGLIRVVGSRPCSVTGCAADVFECC
jgi:hypothetical protein